jgi:hypothetical protein
MLLRTCEPRTGGYPGGAQKENVLVAADLKIIALPPRSVNPYAVAADLLVEDIARAGWPWTPALSLMVDGLDQAAEEHEEMVA